MGADEVPVIVGVVAPTARLIAMPIRERLDCNHDFGDVCVGLREIPSLSGVTPDFFQIAVGARP